MAPDPAPLAAGAPAPRWKCVLAGTPQLLLALQFLLPIWHVSLFGLSRYDLTGIMMVEGMVLMVAVYFIAIWLWKPVDPYWLRIRWWIFALMAVPYFGAAVAAGVEEAILFLTMALVTYFGLLMSWQHPTALLQLGARWAVAIAAMWVATTVAGTPDLLTDWRDSPKVLVAGTLYFSALAAVEISGFYLQYIPRNAGPIMELLHKLLENFKMWVRTGGRRP